VKLLKYTLEINLIHEDVLIRLFLSLETRQKKWFKHSCTLKSIYSLIVLIEEFLKWWDLIFQRYEDIIQDLTTTIQEDALFSNPIEDDEDFIE